MCWANSLKSGERLVLRLRNYTPSIAYFRLPGIHFKARMGGYGRQWFSRVGGQGEQRRGRVFRDLVRFMPGGMLSCSQTDY